MPVAADNNSSENKKTLNLSIKGGRVNKKTPRSLILPPCLELGGNTLYIIDYVPSCTLQLADEAGNVFYEAYIPEGIEEWQLPTALFSLKQQDIPKASPCHECSVFEVCRNKLAKRVCYVDIAKMNHQNSLGYPDPRCPMAKDVDVIL